MMHLPNPQVPTRVHPKITAHPVLQTQIAIRLRTLTVLLQISASSERIMIHKGLPLTGSSLCLSMDHLHELSPTEPAAANTLQIL